MLVGRSCNTIQIAQQALYIAPAIVERIGLPMVFALPLHAAIYTELIGSESCAIVLPAHLGSGIDIKKRHGILAARPNPGEGILQDSLDRRWKMPNFVKE